MFFRKKKRRNKPEITLTRAQRRQIAEAVNVARRDDGTPRTAQQSIPYQRMHPDGICRVTDHYYTKTIRFEDINYQLAAKEDQESIFGGWCGVLNYFDPAVYVQLSFLNLPMARADTDFTQLPRHKGAERLSDEFSQVLRGQKAKGTNGLNKTKYLTFGIEADNLQVARPRLERIELDLCNNLKRLGVQTMALDGKARLELLYKVFRMDGPPFRFEWPWLAAGGYSTKDFIAPSSMTFRSGRMFRIGAQYGAASFVQLLAPEISDRMLADILGGDGVMLCSLHLHSIDHGKAIKMVKRKMTDVNSMKVSEQMKASRSGYDIDILPADLTTYGTEAENLLRDLQSRNERMFLLTFVVVHLADSKQALENAIFQTAGVVQQHNCALLRLDYQQEQGFMSSLPLGRNQIEIERGLTTSAVAAFVPFTSAELFQNSPEALYCGLNALSNNMIMVDRKLLKNPNGLILGTPGSGKSFAAKREIVNAFLVTQDDIVVCDPESEYAPLVGKLGGQVIQLSPTSSDYINPMDINLNYADGDNPVSLKSDFLLSLCELIVGGRAGLEPVEKTVIDRCVHLVYRDYLADPAHAPMPILQDLYEALLAQPEPEARRVAAALELYVTGSLNVFNHRTNVDLNNRVICFDIKELGTQLKKLGMLTVQDQVWGRVTANRASGKSTRYYMDEMHLLLREPQTAAYTAEIWKRFRKWGGIPTGLTQNCADFLASPEVENIFGNSDYVIMLNQTAKDREILARQLNISPQQLSYVTQSGEGEGLLFYGNAILPFVDRFPTNTELYRILSTKFTEVAHGAS